MRIHFGLHRDGLHPALPTNTVGEMTVGPRGFLRLLESDLGLPPVGLHAAEVAAVYRNCLAECDDLARFYHGSFTVDPVGVARTLLDWRDVWYLHGWDGAFPPGVPQRLADLAAVETLAKDRVPPSVGQRLRRIETLLGKHRTQVENVTLLDHPDDLPIMWRRLLGQFDCDQAPAHTGAALPDTDLGKTQAMLRGAPPGELCGDGSLVVMRATSRDVSAQATAELLRRSEDRSRAVAIANRDGIILDNAFERVGLPRAGFQHYSPFRAASQVLKLTLALIWEPLDPHRLLQFLIHPVSPLSWSVRSRLAEAVAAEPGIGGPAWHAAMTDIDDPADVEFWAAPPRFSVATGAPVTVLDERVRQCTRWLVSMLATVEDDEETAVFAAAVAQARALTATLERLADADTTHLAKIEADRLVDEVTRSLPDASTFAEAGHVPATTHPGNVAAPVDEVYWWDLASAQLDLTPIWTRAERAALSATGVQLPSTEDRLASERRAWLRPALNCRRRLVLVVHDEAGTGRHPLWGRIEEQLSGWVDVRLDAGLLRGEQRELDKLAIPTPALAVKPLPVKQRWWRINRALAPRAAESYTSLAKAYYHPHEWVLQYHAGLRTSRIADVADGALLKGSLAHRLFERFFTENTNWRSLSRDAIAGWLDATIADLIEKEGAVLLENGRGVDRQQVVTTLERSLLVLLEHLAEANVVEASSEFHVERPFPGGVLQGDVDLVLVNDQGERAVLDAKWGSERFRLDEIEKDRHLQLAVYGFTLAEMGWPSAGYYIVTTGNVLTPDSTFFPTALGANGSAVEDIWRRGLVTFDWRCRQFANGEIEVNAGAEPDERSAPPDRGLDTLVPPDRFDDFRWLTGVESFQ